MSIHDEPWGPLGSSAYDNWILFAGYYRDVETELYHVRNRSYHPDLGRWLQRDPLGYVDGMNLYRYVRSAPTRYTDPYGLLITSVDTWWWFWQRNHRGLTHAEYEAARRILNTGCIGISRLLTGGTGHRPLTADCYDSFEKAKERRNDKSLKEACCKKKDVDGKPAELKIVSMKFWNRDAAGNQIVSAGPGGQVNMTPYWDETETNGSPVNPYILPDQAMNFDFGYLHEGLWDTWWHANHEHVPARGEYMWVYLSDTWWYNRRADWQSPGLSQVWCVVCNDWKLGRGMSGQGSQGSP